MSPTLLINSFTYFKNYQLRESLAYAWISIEQILEYIWNQNILVEAKKVNIPKRNKFLESQQWNSAHKVEMLYQKSIINEDLYSFLSVARFARNDFIHKGIKPTYDQVYTSLNALIYLIDIASKFTGVKFIKENVEKYIKENSIKNIPQTFVKKRKIEEPMNVSYWSYLKVIPGDKDWKGDFETFPDITLQRIKR